MLSYLSNESIDFLGLVPGAAPVRRVTFAEGPRRRAESEPLPRRLEPRRIRAETLPAEIAARRHFEAFIDVSGTF